MSTAPALSKPNGALPPANSPSASGIRFGFTAEDFPISAPFAVFLDEVTGGNSFDGYKERDWGDQITEKMSPSMKEGDIYTFIQKTRAAANLAFSKPEGNLLVGRAYNAFASLLAGNSAFLSELQGKNRFIFVVSAPRHGGSYLTKELLRAMGKNYNDYPSYFIHDGFPDIRYDWISHDGMESIPMTRRAIQQTAEWITMADWFFRDDRPNKGLRTIPKKATKSIYEARFFRDVFGFNAEYVVPIRHPAAACQSLVDKAGGMTNDGLFPLYPRSSIENWVQETWANDGVSAHDVSKMSYFTAYLHYWNRYFQVLAVNGMLRNNQKLTILPYTASSFEKYLQSQHDRFHSGRSVESMHIQGKVSALHPEWIQESQPVLQAMSILWESFGVPFPLNELQEAL